LTPVQVVDPSNPHGLLLGIASVAAGGAHSLALKDDGGVRAWGAKGVGQLGNGTAAISLLPVRVVDRSDPSGFLMGIDRVSAAGAVSMALTSVKTLRAWGGNAFGNLGDGTTMDRLTQVPVKDLSDPSGFLTDVSAVSPGGTHALALKTDGTVRSWGINSEGQLGCGCPISTGFQFVQVLISGVLAVSASGQFSLAARADGTAWAWGQNVNGQLGNNSQVRSLAPVQVKDPSDLSGFLQNVTKVAGGGNFSLALKNDMTVWAWGDNTNGQLGHNTNTTRLTPVQVKDPLDGSGFLTNVTGIAAGGGFSLALKPDGTVWAWGLNAIGQLGDGTTTTPRRTPVQVVGLTGVTAIAAGGFSLALKADGTVWAWGANGTGSLGDGTTENRRTPIQVRDSSGFLTSVTAIAAGGGHSLAGLSDTTVRAWGSNSNGQLGSGTDPNTLTPVKVSFP
jgi:alpha-tubulin suppressor-like RCC1 family protein